MIVSEQNLFNKTTTTITTTCLFVLLISFSTTTTNMNISQHVLLLFFAFAAIVVGGFIVLAVRTTIVAWITVLVLLAFVGKRRRVLAKDGQKITLDVGLYLANEVIKEKRIVAISGVMIMGLMAMAFL